MCNPFEDVKSFHEKFGLAYNGKPRALPPAIQKFRDKFHREELKEYSEAIRAIADILDNKTQPSIDDDVALELSHAFDGMLDLMYVVIGTMYLHGFPMQEGWKRVHAANMSKVRAKKGGDSKRKSRYDVVKPPGWEPPRIQPLVSDHAHT